MHDVAHVHMSLLTVKAAVGTLQNLKGAQILPVYLIMTLRGRILLVMQGFACRALSVPFGIGVTCMLFGFITGLLTRIVSICGKMRFHLFLKYYNPQ